MYITNTNTQRQRQQNNLNLGPLRHQKPMMSRWLHLFSENARVLTFTLHQKRTRPSFICQVVCTKTTVLNALLEAMMCTIFTVELLDFNNTFPVCPCSLTLSTYEDNWTFLASRQCNFSCLPAFCACELCMPETSCIFGGKNLITDGFNNIHRRACMLILVHRLPTIGHLKPVIGLQCHLKEPSSLFVTISK